MQDCGEPVGGSKALVCCHLLLMAEAKKKMGQSQTAKRWCGYPESFYACLCTLSTRYHIYIQVISAGLSVIRQYRHTVVQPCRPVSKPRFGPWRRRCSGSELWPQPGCRCAAWTGCSPGSGCGCWATGGWCHPPNWEDGQVRNWMSTHKHGFMPFKVCFYHHWIFNQPN